MKKLLTIFFSLFATTMIVQADNYFTPVKPSSLRLPSTPLIANDPYFCIWSPYNNLYDGVTTYFSNAPKPITGVLRVDGECYRFMGACLSSVAPMATEGLWTARYTKTTPDGEWYASGYNDSSWTSGKGAFGGGDGAYGNIGTQWSGDGTDVYVRRSFTLDDTDGDYYVTYKHDDVCELYLNGQLIAQHGNEWNTDGITIHVASSLLKKGENVFAAHCHNTRGGAYLDFGLYKNTMQTATQRSCQVLATQTYYDFACGPVDLNLVFTSPQLIDELEIQSYPASFISYEVKSNDGKAHDVQIYLGTSAQLGVSSSGQSTTTSRTASNGFVYARGGTSNQNVLHGTGDGQIDWGYVYLYSDVIEGEKDIIVNEDAVVMDEFQQNGGIAATKSALSKAGGTYPAMACVHRLGTVSAEGVSSHIMMAYDDVYSINYMGSKRKAYWLAITSRTSFTSRMKTFFQEYDELMQKCRNLDERIYNDALASGGVKYAEILSGVYRQTMAAHKLVNDTEGNLLWMSRENNSGGFINTVDITYPSAPLTLIYNPELCRAMITSHLDYSASGKWSKGFCSHDLGAYPIATGQTYGGDMPLEESADMVILVALLQKLTGNSEYSLKYWDLITLWTDYLVANGKTPTNQLCTDDFMGPSDKNANLSLKACMGVYSYVELAKMLGKDDVAEAYLTKAEAMAKYWKTNCMTRTSPIHSRLAVSGGNNTWSGKYNMVWDMLWDWNVFEEQRLADMAFYQTKMLPFGLPLDSRGDYNKNDWHFWIGAMAADDTEFQTYLDPMYRYINETPVGTTLCDYNDAHTGKGNGYKGRPVVAGYWMKVFMDKFRSGELTGIENVPVKNETGSRSQATYNLAGQRVSSTTKGIVITEGKKHINK